MLLGAQITIFTDLKKLTFKTRSTCLSKTIHSPSNTFKASKIHWLIEELGPNKGKIIVFENLPSQNILDEIDNVYHFETT